MVGMEQLDIGKFYTRNVLAEQWGYKSFQAISRGVVTPKNTNLIILFVTHKKQASLTQYEDALDGQYLYWEGEKNHSNDNRVIRYRQNEDEIHLFYRHIHHTPFEYMGKLDLESIQLNQTGPISAVFRLADLPTAQEEIESHESEWRDLPETERSSIVSSRIGQGIFRRDLIRRWGGCSVTNLPMLNLLRASHIKPWRISDNFERLDSSNGLLLVPTLDLLFDKGFISFNHLGRIIISKSIPIVHYDKIGISTSLILRDIDANLNKYLEYHRDCILIRDD